MFVLVFLVLLVQLDVHACFGQYSFLDELGHCVLEASLLATLEELEGALLVQKLREPLHVLREVGRLDTFVLDEGEDVDQSHVVAIDHREDQ